MDPDDFALCSAEKTNRVRLKELRLEFEEDRNKRHYKLKKFN